MSWHGKKIDPEELHGKEEWEKMQKHYLDQSYKACITHIESLLDSAFELHAPIKTDRNLETGELLQYPLFLIDNKNFNEFYSSDSLRKNDSKHNESTLADLIAEKDSLENHLKLTGEDCNKVFKAVADVLRDFIKSDLDRILNSGKPIIEKTNRLEKLIEHSNDLVAFFGVHYPDKKANSGGLIYGTDVNDCLLSINHIGAVETTLEGRFIPQRNYFSTDQTEVSLDSLKRLQQLALPKAKDFIKVQIALNRKLSTNLSASDQLRDPVKVANEYVSRDNYNPQNGLAEEVIRNVMELTKKFIEENDIDFMFGKANTVAKKCDHLPGHINAHWNIVKYYSVENNRYKKPTEKSS